MGTSDRIARFILDALESADGTAELQRSSLADRFGCVPSQINYVIATRFSPERGYMVESRRGGGGYIRITRVQPDASQFIMHTVNAVGRELDKPTADALLHNAVNAGALEVPFARLIAAAVSERALHAVPVEIRKTVRSSIFKQMLLTTASDGNARSARRTKLSSIIRNPLTERPRKSTCAPNAPIRKVSTGSSSARRTAC